MSEQVAASDPGNAPTAAAGTDAGLLGGADTAPAAEEQSGSPLEGVYTTKVEGQKEEPAPEVPAKESSEEPAKTEEAGKAEADPKKSLLDQAEEAPAAPEAYEAFEMPEGIESDSALTEAFTPLARELGLTQEQAQKMATMYATHIQGQVDTHTQGEQQRLADMQKEITSVPGYQEHLLGPAAKALNLVSPEDAAAIKALDGGNNPSVIRLLAEVGRRMGEDPMTSPAGKAAAAPQGPQGLESMYNQMDL